LVMLLMAYALRGGGCAPDGTAEAVGQPAAPPLDAVDTTSMLQELGSETKTAAEEFLKASTRTSLAVLSLLVNVGNEVSKGTATVGDTIATGAEKVESVASPVWLLNTITAGIKNAIVTVTGTFSENSRHSIMGRRKGIKELREKLNAFTPGAHTAPGPAPEPAKPDEPTS